MRGNGGQKAGLGISELSSAYRTVSVYLYMYALYQQLTSCVLRMAKCLPFRDGGGIVFKPRRSHLGGEKSLKT